MQKLRNIAIIAHVDHGKTTLVDKMILAGHILRDNAKPAGELILDNNDLERERGITILSKNVSVIYKDYKINIIDTPGHADFGGEVERVLNMCDGVTMQKTRIKELMVFEGLGKKKVEEVPCGEICAIMGIDGFEIGDTVCDYENPEPLPPIAIDEPTMSMLFTINNSPFFGKDGKYVTSRHIKERLDRELEKNLALRVTPGPSADSFNVFGRGVLHLSVLIETMRREGYELQVGQPHVIVKEIDGKKCEPIEEMTVDCPEEYSGTVIDLTTRRKGTLTNMASDGERTRLEFDIPSRGIIGLRSNMLTATAGEAIMTHRLKGFEPWVGEIEMRTNGSIISGETGTAYAYSIDKLQDRGRFFISPMEQVYAGQVIGEHTRQNDITVNVTKAKQLTNMRASGSDDKTSIAPPKVFTLEEALEYIQGDEYVEVTPHSMRLRKILLDENDRKRAAK